MRITAVCGLLALFSAALCGSAQAQDNYEIQVYGYDTVEPHHTTVELHSNFTFEGSKTLGDLLPRLKPGASQSTAALLHRG